MSSKLKTVSPRSPAAPHATETRAELAAADAVPFRAVVVGTIVSDGGGVTGLVPLDESEEVALRTEVAVAELVMLTDVGRTVTGAMDES